MHPNGTFPVEKLYFRFTSPNCCTNIKFASRPAQPAYDKRLRNRDSSFEVSPCGVRTIQICKFLPMFHLVL